MNANGLGYDFVVENVGTTFPNMKSSRIKSSKV